MGVKGKRTKDWDFMYDYDIDLAIKVLQYLHEKIDEAEILKEMQSGEEREIKELKDKIDVIKYDFAQYLEYEPLDDRSSKKKYSPENRRDRIKAALRKYLNL